MADPNIPIAPNVMTSLVQHEVPPWVCERTLRWLAQSFSDVAVALDEDAGDSEMLRGMLAAFEEAEHQCTGIADHVAARKDHVAARKVEWERLGSDGLANVRQVDPESDEGKKMLADAFASLFPGVPNPESETN